MPIGRLGNLRRVELFSRQWFLLALATALALGFGFPEPFRPIAQSALVRNSIVVVVMLLLGWTLKPSAISRSVREPRGSVIASLINIFAVPLLTLPLLRFLPSELAGGLAVASLVPCTLATASVWTRAAKGDEAISMMTTVVTNLLCFIVAPTGIWLILGAQAEVDLVEQIKGLLIQVVLPLVGGQVLRMIGLAAFADRCKPILSNTAQVGILVMVLLGSVLSYEKLPDPESGSGGVIALVATGAFAAFAHLTAVVLGYVASRAAGLPVDKQVAVAISGAQKTLMIGLQLSLDCGVSVIPMVMYHVGQLLIDTLLVKQWNRHHAKEKQEPVKSK